MKILDLLSCFLVVLATIVQTHASSTVKLLDKSDQIDIYSIAGIVCEIFGGNGRQISRLSTVAKLAVYLEEEVTDEEDSNLLDCKRRHLESIQLLNEVFTVSNENVCSDAKLDLIEKFHNQFVSTQKEQQETREDADKEVAPKLLRVLFMHYALEVDAICKRALISNLGWALEEKFGRDFSEHPSALVDFKKESDRALFEKEFQDGVEKLGYFYTVEKYEDALLIWDLVDSSRAKANLGIENEIDPFTNETIRTIAKVKTPGFLEKIKEVCHFKLKPIYAKLILPVIRLANLGYSNGDEHLRNSLQELESMDKVKRWFNVTQFCESVLPVRLFEDPSLEETDVVFITKQKADELDQAGSRQTNPIDPAKRPIEFEPETNSMLNTDQLDTVGFTKASDIVELVHDNLQRRKFVKLAAMAKLVFKVKAEMKSEQKGSLMVAGAKQDASKADSMGKIDDGQMTANQNQDVITLLASTQKEKPMPCGFGSCGVGLIAPRAKSWFKEAKKNPFLTAIFVAYELLFFVVIGAGIFGMTLVFG